jgi:hypothetical protein
MFKPNTELSEMFKKKPTEYSVPKEWQFFVQDIPVSRELYNFVQDINVKQAEFKYFPCDSKWLEFKENDERVLIAKSLYVYMDSMPFILGAVGYGDFSQSRNGDKTYMVYSRKISNAKYNGFNDQYHMTLSTAINKAVKNASKFIVPYTNVEIASVYFDDVSDKITTNVNNAREAFYDTVHSIKHNQSLLAEEMLHLTKSGVQFKDPIFVEMANKIVDRYDRHTFYQLRKVDVTFVCFKQGNTTTITTMDVNNITKTNVFSHNFDKKAENINTYTMETLPEELSSKVAVLNILNDKQYVEDVGMKINNNTFWIERASTYA